MSIKDFFPKTFTSYLENCVLEFHGPMIKNDFSEFYSKVSGEN
jgi:hypothetical protein